MPTKESTASPNRRSGNPAKRASSVSDFKQKSGRALDLLELPSGATAKVVNRGMRAFLSEGMVPNSLMSIVEESLNKGRPPEMSEVVGENMDPKMVDDMYRLMDNAVILCFVEPRVLPAPDLGEERDDDLLYVDEIDDEDKMFLFQWVTGGTRDVEQFRRQLATDLAAVSGSQDVGSAPKRASRARGSSRR